MACMAKPVYVFLSNQKIWCDMVRCRYYRHGVAINCHRYSSIWKGIQTITMEIRWIIGKNSEFSLWFDNWPNGRSISSFMSIPDALLFTRNFSVKQHISNGAWNIPSEIQTLSPVLTTEIMEVCISDLNCDELVWDGDVNGKMTMKLAYNFYRDRSVQQTWKRKLWNSFVSLKISIFVWKICNNRLLTGDVLFRRGLLPSSYCVGCIVGREETDNHLLLHCEIAHNVWC